MLWLNTTEKQRRAGLQSQFLDSQGCTHKPWGSVWEYVNLSPASAA